MSTLLIALGLYFCGSAILWWWQMHKAPAGWEDERGFHIGEEPFSPQNPDARPQTPNL